LPNDAKFVPTSNAAHCQALPTFIQEIIPEDGPPKDLSTTSCIAALTTCTQSHPQIKVRPYADNFYQYHWFYGLVLLLITSTAAVAGIVLSWASSTTDMIYFTNFAIPTIGLEAAKFYVLPIFVYVLFFLQTPNSMSIAEWFVQMVCRWGDRGVQEKALVILSIILLVMFMFMMLLPFYFMVNTG